MHAIQGIRRQVCPRCRHGAIFRCRLWQGPLTMFERCPECGLKYDREQGYFIGALYVSYLLSIPPVLVLVAAFWPFATWGWALIYALVAYLPLVPFVARLSRVVWMYVDQAVDPE